MNNKEDERIAKGYPCSTSHYNCISCFECVNIFFDRWLLPRKTGRKRKTNNNNGNDDYNNIIVVY